MCEVHEKCIDTVYKVCVVLCVLGTCINAAISFTSTVP